MLPVHERATAADSLSSEAYWRVKDPVYGSAGVVIQVQEEICATRCELARTLAQISMHQAHEAPEPQQPSPPVSLGAQDINNLMFEPNDTFNLS